MTLPPQLARRFGAFFTSLVGAMNVVSALYPAIPSRLEILQDLLPLHVIRASQTATVLTGFGLILLADGLRKRRRRAMQLTVALLVASCVLNLSKGLDFEESTLAAILAAGLVVHARAFDVSSALPAPQRLLPGIATFALLYYCYVLAGFLVLRAAVHPHPTLLPSTLEPLRVLFAAPHYHYVTAQARWFERSLAIVAGAVALDAILMLLRPLIPRRAAGPRERRLAREILARHGADTLSYFSLQAGRSYFFDESGEAFLSYRLWGNVAIVAGDPVGPTSRIRPLVSAFLEHADRSGMEPCFLGIAAAHVGLYSELNMRTLKVGEEALIDLPAFKSSSLKRKVRRAIRHVEEQGITAVTLPRADIPDHFLKQMEAISHLWVRDRGGAERGFSMTLGRLPGPEDGDCQVTLAVEGDQLWGYICLVPAGAGRNWSLDAMRRRAESPNGLMEFLVIRSAETLRAGGAQLLSLNFATLSNIQNDINSRAVDGTRRLLYQYLSSFYQMRTLEQFNGKFQPRWHSRYLAYRDVLKIPKLAIAIAQCEDPIRIPSPAALLRR